LRRCLQDRLEYTDVVVRFNARRDADVGGDPFQVGDAGRTADVREVDEVLL